MRAKQLRSSFLLFIAAFIWGIAFVAQSAGMEYIGPFSFVFLRNIIGAVVLLPIVIFGKDKTKAKDKRVLVISAVFSGIALGAASCLQQYGIMYTSVGKAGFLTAMYIIIVPVLSIFFGRKISVATLISVAMAVAGIYLLCIKDGFSINSGDIYEFLCAVVFSLQILIISRFSHRTNAYKFACIQFLAAAAVAFATMYIVGESFTWQQVQAARIPLAYAGVLSSGAAYTLQIIGERDLNPTAAALIMSLESCISAAAAWLILGQTMNPREIAGCVIMFAAIILVQIKND